MNKRLTVAAIATLAAGGLYAQFTIDWSKIEFWAGSGPNRAALVVQFKDDPAKEAYVWGYRWQDGTEPSGEDMFRAIAAISPDLELFTQCTGSMGNTVCGIGYSPQHSVINGLTFDFDGAREDARISFNWFSANTSMGQTTIPGWDTPQLCEEAIHKAKTTHIIDHPIDAKNYGYPAYDYDYWQMTDYQDQALWNAGWYNGYWSYWVGGAESSSLSYSGLGMTSRKLTNECVDAWKYQSLEASGVPARHDRAQNVKTDGNSGASTPWYTLNYSHFGSLSVSGANGDENMRGAVVYTSMGIKVGDVNDDISLAHLISALEPGVYIVHTAKSAKKIYIR